VDEVVAPAALEPTERRGGTRPVDMFAFGGPWGSLGLTIGLPLVVYYLWVCIVDHGGALLWPRSGADLVELIRRVPLPTPRSVALYGAWLCLQVLLQVLMPGPWKEGQPTHDGTRLKYRMNGWISWWLTWAIVILAVVSGILPATFFYDEYGPLLSTVVVFAFAYSGYLHWHGRRFGRNEVVHGNAIHDFFMGTSLNPRTGTFDHKLFCEARPGLILWVVGNFSIAAKQYALHGTITTPMILVCLFHFFYIADYYFHEEAILTTWDIKHENFGFMLCFGDLVWVPFTYTFQALYLVGHPHGLPWWGTAGIVALNVAGFVVFRWSNIQKHRFRSDPSRPVWGRPPEYIRTKRGTLLLLSGWWGKARHINYMGDLMMALAWCLPCLFGSVVPYFYIIYFTILLVLRERRDNAMCAVKYGADWKEYTRRVPWRIVPRIY
jgi:protein-S-isoprenylcysteine O-methyltransferase Ste14